MPKPWRSALEGAMLANGGWSHGIFPSRDDGGSRQKPRSPSDGGAIAFGKAMAIIDGRNPVGRRMMDPWHSWKPSLWAMELK